MVRKISFGALVALLALAFSCSDTNETAGFDELSDFAKSFLSLRSNSAATVGGPVSGAINRSFQNLSGFAISGGRKKDGPNEGDTTLVDPWPWQRCAQITEFDNENGSHTVIHDYGEGCEEGWGEFTWLMFGKFTETYRYLFNQTGSVFTDDYYYYVDYDKYGGRYLNDSLNWRLDGTSVYEGTSTYDTATYNFSGAFNYESQFTYDYGDWSYAYQASGATEYNEKQYEMKSGEYRYAQGTDFYHSEVLRSLVYRYDCFSLSVFEGCLMLTYVSGQERITYKQGDNEGSFIIDYGNGECDNVIFIIENGKRIKIDLSRDPWLVGIN